MAIRNCSLQRADSVVNLDPLSELVSRGMWRDVQTCSLLEDHIKTISCDWGIDIAGSVQANSDKSLGLICQGVVQHPSSLRYNIRKCRETRHTT